MVPGRMRWRVQIQRFTESIDAYRQRQKTWSTVATRWAEIVTLSGRELTSAQQRQAQTTHRVTLRHLGAEGSITPKDKVVFRGREFHVLWIDNVDERNRQLDVYCEEKLTP